MLPLSPMNGTSHTEPDAGIEAQEVAAVVRSRLRVKHLELFLNLCRLHSLRKAAVASNITQPSATKLIHEIEDMLGTALFDRDRRGMQLTPRGVLVRRHVEIVMADLASLGKDLQRYSEIGNGEIRLGIIPSLSSPLLARSIDRLLSIYPRASFRLTEGSTDQLLESLANNKLDLTFSRILGYDQSLDFQVMNIYQEYFEIVCGSSHALAQQRSVSWDDLVTERWVLPEIGSPFRQATDNMFTIHGLLRPVVAVSSTSFNHMLHVIASGQMVGMLPRTIANIGKTNGNLATLDVGNPIDIPPISLVTRKNVEHPPLITTFISLVKESAAAMGVA